MGLLAIAPLFGNRSIPARIKVALGLLLSAIVAPTVGALPQMDPMSMTGVLVLAQQFIIGIAMGFAMRIVFTAVELAGELCGMTMGLGFATFFDPQSAGRSSAISQYLSLITLMVYLAANLHLVVVSTRGGSLTTKPVKAKPKGGARFCEQAGWGGRIFSAGVQLAMPVVAGLLITNIALGILTRAAPQLNLFGVGFPVTLTVGFLMLALTLPYLAVPLERLFADGFAMMRQITAGLPRI
jgi:flagellar biosynthetic protein FliR